MTKKVNVGSVGHGVEESNEPNFQLKQSVKTMLDPKGQMEKDDDDMVLVDIEDDLDFLKDSDYKWEDLSDLFQDLSLAIQEFIGSVNSIIGNQHIIGNLGANEARFAKLVEQFFNDLEEYSVSVAAIKRNHENKSGQLESLEEFDEYNRLAIEYHHLFEQLQALISPTLSAIMVIVTDATEGVKLEDVMGEDFHEEEAVEAEEAEDE